ncbi:unnamed protein product [Kluyveromyces dobzhanskii CBS 2104]|uniref:WGS project CCBQ000000000 data, contig 00058 n=1 Tax=Kluyveromyces dobzhanskii CBS 2104 TaxID=1427455 RepID=A0A0A8LDQ0_9SACH|nr:unnamed protein product [Kluyveromyces dobzhanskii CBS 2104]
MSNSQSRVPLLGSPKTKAKRTRRRSVFQNADMQPSYSVKVDNSDSMGLLHDTDEDDDEVDDHAFKHSSSRKSHGSYETQFSGSYIDHRPSLAMLDQSSSSVKKKASSRASFSDPFTQGQSAAMAQSTSKSKSFQGSNAARKNSNVGPRALPLDRSTSAGNYGSLNNRNDVVIDMDALMEHVKRKNRSLSSVSSKPGSLPKASSDEGYNSQPSSRGTSDSSSLNDVCLPIDDETEEGSKVWPDVSVLEEFSQEEIERLRREAMRDTENFHFQYDDDEFDHDYSDEERLVSFGAQNAGNLESQRNNSNGLTFTRPIITNIDVPELGNTRVNETEHMKHGRLRPKKLTPWHLKRGNLNLPGLSSAAVSNQAPANTKPAHGLNSKVGSVKSNAKLAESRSSTDSRRDDLFVGRNIQYPPHIISNNPEIFRFTYFREDLDSTIHSPTVSGLLQPGQKFDELFVSSVYAQPSSTSNADTRDMTPGVGTNTAPTNFTNSSLPAKNSAAPTVDLENPSPFWLDILNPTEEEMKVVSKAFGIHPLTTEDIFLGEVREKVELFKDYYLVCFRSFDIVAERHIRKKKQQQQQKQSDSESSDSDDDSPQSNWFKSLFKSKRRSSVARTVSSSNSSVQRKARKEKEEIEKYKRKSGDRRKPRAGELEPLNVYILVFRTGVLTFHFAPTPHPINVRRRARLLKDYLNVTADWIAYALIDDITDAFAPMIELIEDEVYDIEDAILKMHHTDDSSDSDSGPDSESSDDDSFYQFDRVSKNTTFSRRTKSSSSSASTRSSSSSASTLNAKNIIGWRKKGDMLRRIGECRKKVMGIVRLLGSKADVIKGFAKRCNEQWEVAPRSEIGMYLGDIQDHIITMVSSLNHYEKLLSRSHSNYLAQINIDMTKVNNDMNDVLGKITILGTVVLPMNIVTGLWGMNVLVPGQEAKSLTWFISIASFMVVAAYVAYVYTKRRFGF